MYRNQFEQDKELGNTIKSEDMMKTDSETKWEKNVRTPFSVIFEGEECNGVR